jgi:hypothetical protein
LALKYEIDAAPSQRHSLTLLLTTLQPLSLSLSVSVLCLSFTYLGWFRSKEVDSLRELLDGKQYVIEKMADKLLVYKQRISSIEIRLSSFVVKILQPDESVAPSRVCSATLKHLCSCCSCTSY